MVNLEHKLTVDDLIVEYMMFKVKNGYEPSFLTSEFINFLYFFEEKMPVEDAIYENDELFRRFFERKSERDWSRTINYRTEEKEVVPHMEMIYSENDEDYLIKANYKLSDFDRSVINTYFMDNGMGKYDDFKGQTYKIRKIIEEYLSNQPKRTIDIKAEVDKSDLIIGQYVAAEIISNIWDTHINKLIENHRWPRQCKDINKYLFEIDLSEIIGVESIKEKLISLYKDFSKRIAVLYHQDNGLRISTSSNVYLARANYNLLIQGHEELMNNTFGMYKKSLDINLSSSTFKESHEIDGVYDWDEDPDVKTTTKNFGNEGAKKLILSINDTLY